MLEKRTMRQSDDMTLTPDFEFPVAEEVAGTVGISPPPGAPEDPSCTDTSGQALPVADGAAVVLTVVANDGGGHPTVAGTTGDPTVYVHDATTGTAVQPTSGNATIDHILSLIGSAVLLPVPKGKKFPPNQGWNKRTIADTEAAIKRGEFTDCNIGVLLGAASRGLCTIDVDTDAEVERFLDRNPALRKTLRTKGARGCQIWIRIKGKYPKLSRIGGINLSSGGPGPLEVGEWRADGGQSIIFGTHPKGMDYQFVVEAPVVEIAFSDIVWPEDWVLSWEIERARVADTPDNAVANASSLDLKKLKNVQPLPGGGFRCACPACRAKGADQTGDHLMIFADGRFGCAVHQDDHTHRQEIFRLARADSADRQSAVGTADGKDERASILLPCDGRLLSDFATELGKCVADQPIFRRGGSVVMLNAAGDGLTTITPEAFRTWIENLVVCEAFRQGGTRVPRTMSKENASGVLASSQFHDQLRSIELVQTIRMPVIRDDGRIEPLPEGYDAATKSITVAGADYRTDMAQEEGKALLTGLLDGFCFLEPDRCRAVVVAALLTLFARALMPPKTLCPTFIALANDVGAGKTLLFTTVLGAVCGHANTASMPRDEDELRKAVLALVMEASPYLFLDNVTGKLDSACLEALATSTEWSGRILGASVNYTGENNLTIFITGNSLTLSSGISRRSLVVELWQGEERPEDRQFGRRLDLGVVLSQRPQILAALYALVRDWDLAGRPKSSVSHASFPAWADVIGGIVEHAGFGSPLVRPCLKQGGDPLVDDMRTLAKVLAGAKGSATFSEVVGQALLFGLFGSVLDGVEKYEQVDVKQRSALGKILSRFNDRIIKVDGEPYRFSIEGKGHSRRYRVEKIGETCTVSMVCTVFRCW